jgi:23S rRNA (cytosine1962-C5)-methyltransferase
VDGFELLDAGDGGRLERIGGHVVDRPAASAWFERRTPRRWADADLRFDPDHGWSGRGLAAARGGWNASVHGLTLELKLTDSGQIGLFAEHGAMLSWLDARIAERSNALCENPRILHLFAYTGLTTLAMARAGASVAHVDAARSAVAWARRNAQLSDLADRPVRWLVDDARAFLAREIRRDRRYDGVVLDPPTYGHGTGSRAWRLDRDLEPLLVDVRRLLVPAGFILLTAHTESITPGFLGSFLGADAETGELSLTASSGALLRLGAFARLDAAA